VEVWEVGVAVKLRESFMVEVGRNDRATWRFHGGFVEVWEARWGFLGLCGTWEVFAWWFEGGVVRYMRGVDANSG